ncbi:MAG: hypothetical protein IH898_02265 [Planctomycetes bacterium]|nr:hypothetical protein [Planctomycetota bacterium]
MALFLFGIAAVAYMKREAWFQLFNPQSGLQVLEWYSTDRIVYPSPVPGVIGTRATELTDNARREGLTMVVLNVAAPIDAIGKGTSPKDWSGSVSLADFTLSGPDGRTYEAMGSRSVLVGHGEAASVLKQMELESFGQGPIRFFVDNATDFSKSVQPVGISLVFFVNRQAVDEDVLRFQFKDDIPIVLRAATRNQR